MKCPKCGGENITTQTFQEQTRSKTVTRRKSKYKEKRHGFFWWLVIGWWWWIVEIILWIVLFPVMFCTKLFRKRKYVGKEKAVSKTKNKFKYVSVYTCQDCGHHWNN